MAGRCALRTVMTGSSRKTWCNACWMSRAAQETTGTRLMRWRIVGGLASVTIGEMINTTNHGRLRVEDDR